MPSSSASRLRVLELFAGIGGCAAALGDAAEVVAAVDIHRGALQVYAHNFPHRTVTAEIESLPPAKFAEFAADLWWLSPPCQPYTRKGNQRDLDDPRAKSLVVLVEHIKQFRPLHVALENVPPFAQSQARALLLGVLADLGYHVRETMLCPTELGVPNRRRRYYLVASRTELLPPVPKTTCPAPLVDYLDAGFDDSLAVPPEILARYAGAIDVVRADDPGAITSCFAAAYGRSPVRSGSYLMTVQGIRHFSPPEMLRLLGFPPSFALPAELSPRQAWPLIGNSLSVLAVRDVLQAIGLASS